MVNQARMRVLVQEPFYQHDHLGPGAPLREITGQGDGNGYFDWAGRRLFLTDGEPDPMCPGAYRYQHNPSACDLEAPDSDPRSPRYEPMHLRHKPGDTWIIDANRPHDPFDPGPFGTPGWYKDERTGRHRRDETPDPLPAEGWTPPDNPWYPGTADWPEPQPPQSEPPRKATRRGGGSDRPPPSTGTGWRPVPSEPDEPPQRFSKLREDAFDRFIVKSAELRAAHFAPEKPYFRERAVWTLHWIAWVLGLGLVPMPRPLTSRHHRIEVSVTQPVRVPAQSGPSPVSRTTTIPGAGIAAAIDGARAARKAIAARETRSSHDLAEAVRNSATYNRAAYNSALHNRAVRNRPAARPSPHPAPHPYVAAWEQAFDHGRTLNLGILGAGGAV